MYLPKTARRAGASATPSGRRLAPSPTAAVPGRGRMAVCVCRAVRRLHVRQKPADRVPLLLPLALIIIRISCQKSSDALSSPSGIPGQHPAAYDGPLRVLFPHHHCCYLPPRTRVLFNPCDADDPASSANTHRSMTVLSLWSLESDEASRDRKTQNQECRTSLARFVQRYPY
jgi:hypothetical protein